MFRFTETFPLGWGGCVGADSTQPRQCGIGGSFKSSLSIPPQYKKSVGTRVEVTHVPTKFTDSGTPSYWRKDEYGVDQPTTMKDTIGDGSVLTPGPIAVIPLASVSTPSQKTPAKKKEAKEQMGSGLADASSAPAPGIDSAGHFQVERMNVGDLLAGGSSDTKVASKRPITPDQAQAAAVVSPPKKVKGSRNPRSRFNFNVM